MTEYTAKSIKVLSDSEARKKFDWLSIELLSQEYNIPMECVERGFITSHILGMSTDYFIDKYVKKLDGIEVNQEFTEVYKELVKKHHQKGSSYV